MENKLFWNHGFRQMFSKIRTQPVDLLSKFTYTVRLISDGSVGVNKQPPRLFYREYIALCKL